MRATKWLVQVAAVGLLVIGSGRVASADENSCAAVRHTRALAAQYGMNLGEIGRLEQLACGGGGNGGGGYGGGYGGGGRRGPRGGRGLEDAEFEGTVMSAIRGANMSDQANTCRYYSRVARLTVEQVTRVIRAVSMANEAPCALAFFDGVLDPINWEQVYRPMSISAGRIVRQAVGQ